MFSMVLPMMKKMIVFLLPVSCGLRFLRLNLYLWSINNNGFSNSVNCLKQTLKIEKEIIALRQLKEELPQFEVYQDKNHICYMMGEVLEEGKTFYTILENHVCLLGCAATGLDPG